MNTSHNRKIGMFLILACVVAISVPALQAVRGGRQNTTGADPVYLPLVLNGASATATLTPTLTFTPTLTLTPTFTNTGALPTPTPSAPHHLVISEFRTVGPLGAQDEFVELYNPTGAAVNIGNWVISKSSACGSFLSTLVTIYYGTMLGPGQHYLTAAYASLSSITAVDQRFSPGIADNGGLALITADGSVVDQVGMCAGTYYYEARPLPPLPVAPLPGTPTPEPGTSDQSYERKPGGNTSCYDTGDNVNDFSLISPAIPQAQANGSVLCAGVVLASPTPSFTPSSTPSPTDTATPTVLPPLTLSVTQSPLAVYPPIMIYTAQLGFVPSTSTEQLDVDFYNLKGSGLEYLGSAPVDKTGKAVLSKPVYPGTYTAIARVGFDSEEIWSNSVMYEVK